MAKVQVETTLQVPASAVWNMIGGFNELARWHPAVVKSEEAKDKGGVTTRRLTLSDGGVIVAELEEHDDKARTYSYSVVETPLPACPRAGRWLKLHGRLDQRVRGLGCAGKRRRQAHPRPLRGRLR